MDISSGNTTSSDRSGILLVVLALSLAALGGALMKLTAESVSPVLVGWFRFSGYFLIILPVALFRVGRHAFNPPRIGVQVVRGALLAIGSLLFVFGVSTLNYADAIAILYIYPFLMTLMAPLVLGERVSTMAWLGVSGGFLGVLIVIRPEFGSLDTNALLILGTGLCVALQMLLNRKLGVLADPAVISLWGAMISMLIMLPFVPFFLSPIEAGLIWLLVSIPCVAAASQTLMILAMSRAEASVLAPFTYTE
ncbi:MAG: DMT family transporter, partial [Pseudomonadota bacterium]